MTFVLQRFGESTLPPSPLTLIEQSTLLEEMEHLRSLAPYAQYGGLLLIRVLGAYEHWRLTVPGGHEGKPAGWQYWGNEDVVGDLAAHLLARSLVFVFAGVSGVTFYAINPERGEGAFFQNVIGPDGQDVLNCAEFLAGSDEDTERRLRRALPQTVTHADTGRAIARAQEVFGAESISFVCAAPDAAPLAEKPS